MYFHQTQKHETFCNFIALIIKMFPLIDISLQCGLICLWLSLLYDKHFTRVSFLFHLNILHKAEKCIGFYSKPMHFSNSATACLNF
jgi:hypothetical protein